MMSWKNFFLAVALVGTIGGLAVSGASSLPLYFVFPLGCASFGMYLIFMALEKEAALFEQEHAPVHVSSKPDIRK